MLEYASIRLTDSCRPATKFATVMVKTASVAITGGHPLAHERRRRGRRALVGVRCPRVEWHGADLEDDTDQDEERAEHEQGIARHRRPGRRPDAGQVRVPGRAIKERKAVEQD